MKTKYKYIHFDKVSERPVIYRCFNNRSGDAIGTVDFYSRWRQYVFSGDSLAVFTVDCLRDIISFIEQLPRKTGTKESP